MKYLLNGFPKAGLHLLDALCKPLTLNKEAGFVATHANNSFTRQRIGVDSITNAVCYTPDNHRVIGHCCYDEDLEWYVMLSAVAHIFIWRDLRDVAVSQAHHILSDNDNLRHPDKEFYRDLGDFEDVLAAVWQGVGKYPGVKERWAEYEPWLDRPNVLVIKYEDAVEDLMKTADRILDFAQSFRPAMLMADGKTTVTSTHVVTNATEMTMYALDKKSSPTFRRGIPGEWRQYRGIFEKSYEQV